MAFSLKLINQEQQETRIDVEVGRPLFILGPNGAGKSSLALEFYRANSANALRISAHRKSWLSSNESVAPEELRQFNASVRNWESHSDARWVDRAESRPRMAISQLVIAENYRARQIADAFTSNEFDEAKARAAGPSAIATINRLFHRSSLPISVSIKEGEQVVASKSGSSEYSIAELSDGERNALVLAASVLTAPTGMLILIDEPERHLHRSITAPLLTHLFAERPDCAFVVSTHEVSLPVDHPDSQVVLIRGCKYLEGRLATYDANIVPAGVGIDNELKKDILGARQRVLFVEGTEQSLDKPLYSELFPTVSVIAKANCRDVVNSVRGVRDASELHWVHAFGLIDGDGRALSEVDSLESGGIYSVPGYSIESIYYHMEVQKKVAERHSRSVGGDFQERLTNAKARALSTISEQHVDHLSERVAEIEARGKVMKQLPTRQDIASRNRITIEVNTERLLADERSRLTRLIEDQDIAAILRRYPLRETGVLEAIAKQLGFTNRKQYESAVLTLLQNDKPSLELVRALFGNLVNAIEAV